uniref:Uncharacterized protein n=1 Tax=Anguilla anguilla TaxID=7936 RepID=A0A0E9V0F1_ANGAN
MGSGAILKPPVTLSWPFSRTHVCPFFLFVWERFITCPCFLYPSIFCFPLAFTPFFSVSGESISPRHLHRCAHLR